jgi:hypothetical protein
VDYKLIMMQVLNGFQELSHEEGSFWFRQTFASLDQFVHALVVAEFQQNVAILAIFKEMLIFTYILVFQCPVNLDFSLQLYRIERSTWREFRILQRTTCSNDTYFLTSSGLDKVSFGDNFDSIRFVRIHGSTEIDFSESSLPKKTSPKITMKSVPVSICLFPLFFNNDTITINLDSGGIRRGAFISFSTRNRGTPRCRGCGRIGSISDSIVGIHSMKMSTIVGGGRRTCQLLVHFIVGRFERRNSLLVEFFR